MQISALSAADLSPIAMAPIHPDKEFGPCLLVVDRRFRLGGFDGAAWHDEDGVIVRPSGWLLLIPE
jgi:hypothetical protein